MKVFCDNHSRSQSASSPPRLMRPPAIAFVAVGLLTLVVMLSLARVTNSQDFSHYLEIKLDRPEMAFTLRYSNSWTVVQDEDKTSTLLLNVPSAELEMAHAASANRLLITTEHRQSTEDTVQRLRQIAAETMADIPVSFVEIGGWPALERNFLDAMPKVSGSGPSVSEIGLLRRVTVAIAVGSTLIRLEGTLRSNDSDALDQIMTIGRSLIFDTPGNPTATQTQIELLRRAPPLPPAYVPAPGALPEVREEKQWARSVEQGQKGVLGFVQNLQNFSEIEVAVSTDGQDIVVGTNSRAYSVSNDGGQRFTQGFIDSQFDSMPPLAVFDIAYPANGDPSLAYGQSGDFYFGFIAFPDGTGGAGNNVQQCTTGITASTDNGRNFGHRGHATTCPFSGAGVCFPDQEHIAADRFNPSGTGQDQLYSAWRNFTPNMGNGRIF